MASSRDLLQNIQQGDLDKTLVHLYGKAALQRQRKRYADALRQFGRYFGAAQDVRIYSVPGRTELCGNHTDHQMGIGLAAAVERDIIAVAAARNNDVVRVKSYGFDKLDIVDLRLKDRQSAEHTHSASLIRGIGCTIEQRSGKIGGFDAYTTSDVLRGSGLSSSAAFETMMGTIWNDLYNEMRFSPLEIAQIGQYAENSYFGKPSGVLDPLTCATGGIICVDMEREGAPTISKIKHPEFAEDIVLCITDTGGSHSELTEEFLQVRDEMESVAKVLGCKKLRQASEKDLWAQLPQIRKVCGDRATLRALHFYQECRRSEQAYRDLSAGDVASFLRHIQESEHSICQYNQNTFCHTTEQPISLALAVSQSVLQGRGAYRMQGSGFAGTIQAFVPKDLLPQYIQRMEAVFVPGCCDVMRVRENGAMRVA